MSVYLDTSVLVRWYILEAGSKVAVALRAKIKSPIPLSPFHRVEMTAACRLKVFRGELDHIVATQALNDFQTEVEAGLFAPVELGFAAVCKRAELLANVYSDRLGMRTLDVMHVASALELKYREFITADARQGELAKACRLKVTQL